jgi:hypothetical protein
VRCRTPDAVHDEHRCHVNGPCTGCATSLRVASRGGSVAQGGCRYSGIAGHGHARDHGASVGGIAQGYPELTHGETLTLGPRTLKSTFREATTLAYILDCFHAMSASLGRLGLQAWANWQPRVAEDPDHPWASSSISAAAPAPPSSPAKGRGSGPLAVKRALRSARRRCKGRYPRERGSSRAARTESTESVRWKAGDSCGGCGCASRPGGSHPGYDQKRNGPSVGAPGPGSKLAISRLSGGGRRRRPRGWCRCRTLPPRGRPRSP